MLELIEAITVDHTAAPKCSDFDDECVDVKDALICMAGNSKCPPADGYCPMLFNRN